MITKFETYKIENNHDIIIDLRKFNEDVTHMRLKKLREMLSGKIVSFRGHNNDKLNIEYIEKSLIENVYGLQNTYEFEVRNGLISDFYKVDLDTPITIHTLESDVNKYNI